MWGRGGGDLVDGEEGDHQPPPGWGLSGTPDLEQWLNGCHSHTLRQNGILLCEFVHKESKPTV